MTCHEFPLRPLYKAQIVVPDDMTKAEADRLCKLIMALATPDALAITNDKSKGMTFEECMNPPECSLFPKCGCPSRYECVYAKKE